MSVLAQPPPTPPPFKMSDPDAETICNKRKALDEKEQDPESNSINHPSIQNLHKENLNLPDTPTSTVSNRVSSSNGKEKHTKEAESPTVNKKAKNNPIIEMDRYNKIKFTSPPASFDTTKAHSKALLAVQEYVQDHQGVIEDLDEDHYQFIALTVQGSQLELKDLARQIFDKVGDDTEMEADSQTEQGQLKPSEKISVDVIVKAIEQVATRINWGLEWEDIDDSVEKGEKIPANHKLARFQLFTWEVKDPSKHLPPKIAPQVTSTSSPTLRSNSRALAIQFFKDLSEEERTAYLKNKAVPKGKGASGKVSKKNNGDPKSDNSEESQEKKIEIKESSIPNTSIATSSKKEQSDSERKEDESRESKEQIPAPSQKPITKGGGSHEKEAISISSDAEDDKDEDGDISMTSNKSSPSKRSQNSRSASPSKRESSPSKGKSKKKELTQEEKEKKEKREIEKQRRETIKEEKRIKEEKIQKEQGKQKNLLAGFLKKSDKSKVTDSTNPFKKPSGSDSNPNSNDKTPSSSAGSKAQIGESSRNSSSPSKATENDFERSFLKFVPSSRQEIAEVNRFPKSKESITPVESLFDQDIPTEDLLSEFKTKNPNRSKRTVSRHQTKPRLVIKEVMSMVAESDAVGGQAALKAAKGLKDIGNPNKVWKKLLQFDGCRRPAYHGTKTQPSNTVGPCTPFHKDAALDYNYESDDAWEDEPEDADELDKDDAEDSSSDAGSEDSWLVDDDMDVDEEITVVPLGDEEDEIVEVDAKGKNLVRKENLKSQLPQNSNPLQTKKKKKGKHLTKLVAFTTGPHWEHGPGLPSYDGFAPFQAQFFNDAHYGLNPFTFVSKIKAGQAAVEQDAEEEDAASAGISSFNSKGKSTAKRVQTTVFPEAKMRELILAINEKPISKSEMVKSILPKFADYTTKAAFERVVSEITEKQGKRWVVKGDLLTRYKVVDDSTFFCPSPQKKSKAL